MSLRGFGAALALGVAGLTAACTDGPVAPPAVPHPAVAPSLTKTSTIPTFNSTTVLSQTVVGDTTVTRFVLGTNTNTGASVLIGNGSEIHFPLQAGSVCDPGTSTYGATEWDKPCTASTSNITVVAKSWVTARGLVHTDFQPALRFVPRLRMPVKLYLRDPSAALSLGERIDFCDARGTCVDEALTDPSVATTEHPVTGHLSRIIKHFSGYTVIAN